MKRRKAKKRRLSLQPLETRRVLAASVGWDGPGLGDATLTYNIANSPYSLSQAEVNAAVETALAVWSDVADITFVPTAQSGLRDSIDISFVHLDGPGRTLAQAYLPDDVNPARIAGDIQLDASEVWEVGNSLGRSAFDLVWVAVHEIGHSLGLDHVNVPGAVLTSSVSPGQQFVGLSPVDVAAVEQLYAPAVDVVVDQAVESPVDAAPVDTETESTEADDNSDDNANETDNRQRRRWRRGWARWGRFGARLTADVPAFHNMYHPTDVNGDDKTSGLDALAIINQLQQFAGGFDDATIDGMCDTNGDGNITAADALLVINSMLVDDSSAESEPADEADETSDAEDPLADEPVDDVTVIVDVEDQGADGDAGPEDETDVVTDDQDDESDNELDDEIDEDSDDEVDEGDDCDDHRFAGRQGRRGLRLIARDPAKLITRFDTNEDGAITEDEVPSFFWQKLVDRNVDQDADGTLTLEELQEAAAVARAERFALFDTNGDGLLQEDEVQPRRWQRISQADSDGDNAVSMDELDTWIAERHNHDDQAMEETNIDQVFAEFERLRIPRFHARF